MSKTEKEIMGFVKIFICGIIMAMSYGMAGGELLGVLFGLGFYYILTPIKMFEEINHYGTCVAGDDLNTANPLYVKGFFRNKKEGFFSSNLKGFFLFQRMILVLSCITIVYLVVVAFVTGEVNSVIGTLLTICYVVLYLYYLGIRAYYIWCYKKGFQYLESAKGIWTPFFAVVQPSQRHQYYISAKPTLYIKHVEYEELCARLGREYLKMGYEFIRSYEQEQGEKICFGLRKDDKKLDIFAVVYIEDFRSDSMNYFNDKFEEYWMSYIQGKINCESHSITMLLCLCETNLLFENQWKETNYLSQKKGKVRCPAVLRYSGKSEDELKLFPSMHEEEEYSEMEQKLLSLLNEAVELN